MAALRRLCVSRKAVDGGKSRRAGRNAQSRPPFKPFIIRVERDEKVCQDIEAELNEAIERAKKVIEKLTKYQTA